MLWLQMGLPNLAYFVIIPEATQYMTVCFDPETNTVGTINKLCFYLTGPL